MAGALPVTATNPVTQPSPVAPQPVVGAGGYGTNNQALLQLLGGNLSGGAGRSGGQELNYAATLGLFGNNKKNSTPIQDIARAMSMGRSITDAQWAQAGLGPGGGDTGMQLQKAIFGTSPQAQDQATGTGALPPGTGFAPIASNPYIGPGALPIPARNPASMIAPAPVRDPASMIAPPGAQNVMPDVSGALARLKGPQMQPRRSVPPGKLASLYAGSR